MHPENLRKPSTPIATPKLVTQPSSKDLQNLGRHGVDSNIAQVCNAADAARTYLPTGDLEIQSGPNDLQIATLKQAPTSHTPTQAALQILGNRGQVQTTSSGLEVVTRQERIAIAEKPLAPPDVILGQLTPEASSQLLQDNIPKAVRAQLEAEEFAKNTDVAELFDTSYKYIQRIRNEILPWAIIQKAKTIAKQDTKTPAFQAEVLALPNADTSVDILQGLHKVTEIPASLEATHEQAIHQIQNVSMETIEQLSIILAKMLTSSREFNQRRTEEILDTWLFIINTKGHTRRELILKNSTGISSSLVTVLTEQPLLLTPNNWKRIIAIADWLEFNVQDAETLLLRYQKSGLSMRDPVITRLALQVETERPDGEFAKNQEQLRQQFKERWKTHKRRGTLLEFIKPGGEADKIINQIVFAVSPAKLKGAVGFEVEGFLHYPYKRDGTYQTQNFIAFQLPEQFYFSFPGDPSNEQYIPIEIKPGLEFCKGQKALQSALLFTLWARRNNHIFTSASLHIHLNKADSPSIVDLYAHGLALEIIDTVYETLELREWLPPYTPAAILLNRMLFGILPAEECYSYMFSVLAQQPSFLELYLTAPHENDQKPDLKYQKNSKLHDVWEQLVQNPEIMRAGLHSPNLSVATKSWRIFLAYKDTELLEWEDIISEALTSPHENIAHAALQVTTPYIKSDPENWTHILTEGINSPHRSVASLTLEILQQSAPRLPTDELQSITAPAFSIDYNYPEITLAILDIIKPRILKEPGVWRSHIEKAISSQHIGIATATLNLIRENFSALKDENTFLKYFLEGALVSPYQEIARQAIQLLQDQILNSPREWLFSIDLALQAPQKANSSNARLIVKLLKAHFSRLCNDDPASCFYIAREALGSPLRDIAIQGLSFAKSALQQEPSKWTHIIEKALVSPHYEIAQYACSYVEQMRKATNSDRDDLQNLVDTAIHKTPHPEIAIALIEIFREDIAKHFSDWTTTITYALLSTHPQIAEAMSETISSQLHRPNKTSALRPIVTAGLLSPHYKVARAILDTMLPHIKSHPTPWVEIIASGLRSPHKDIALTISQLLLENIELPTLAAPGNAYWRLIGEGLRSPHAAIRKKSYKIAQRLILSLPTTGELPAYIVSVIRSLVASKYPEAKDTVKQLLQKYKSAIDIDSLTDTLYACLTLPDMQLAQLAVQILYEHVYDVSSSKTMPSILEHAIENSKFPEIKRKLFDIFRLVSTKDPSDSLMEQTDIPEEGPILRQIFSGYLLSLVSPQNRSLFKIVLGAPPRFYLKTIPQILPTTSRRFWYKCSI